MAEVPEASRLDRASESTSPTANSTSSSSSAASSHSTGNRDSSVVAAASPPVAAGDPVTPTASVTVPALQQFLAVLAAGADSAQRAVTVAQVTARLAPGGTTLSTRVARLRPILPKPALQAHKTDPLNLKSVCAQLSPGNGGSARSGGDGEGPVGPAAVTGQSSSSAPNGNVTPGSTAVRVPALNYPTPSTLSSCSSPTQSQLSDFDIPSPLSMSDRSTPLDFSPTVDVAAARSDDTSRERLAPKNISQRTRTQASANGPHKGLLGSDRASVFIMGAGFSNGGTTQSSAPSSCPPATDQFISAARTAPPAEFIAETPIALEANHNSSAARSETTRSPAQSGHEHVNLDELRYTTLGEVLAARASPSSAPSDPSVTLRGGLHTPPPSECAVEAQALGQPQILSSRSHSLHSLNFQPNNGHIDAPPVFDSLLCATPGPAEHHNAAGSTPHGASEPSAADGSNILQNAIYISQLM